MNKVMVTGRICNDLVLRNTGKKDAIMFTVASQRDFKNQDGKYDSDFIQCKAFGNTAKFISDYFNKGDGIEIVGSINTNSYTNEQGEKVYTTAVLVDNVSFTIANKKEENKPNNEPDNELPF